jgi:O-antigen/teichoic acid export membrane protein
MLGYYKGNSEVGIYNAAYKIFLVFIVPFQLILTAFFPKLSRNKPSKLNNFKSLFYTYSLSLFISSLIIFFVLFYFSNDIIHIVFGLKYAEAYKPLSILSLNVLVIGINIVFGNPLIAWGQQKKYIIPIGIGAITNIILNIILIPKYSYNGAAIATLFSEVAVFIGIIIYFNIYYSKNIKLES